MKTSDINIGRLCLRVAVSWLISAIPTIAQVVVTPGRIPVVVPSTSASPAEKMTHPHLSTDQSLAFPSNSAHGQAKSVGEVVLSNLANPLPVLPAPTGVLVDQVVAVVNGELVLESDVDEENRLMAFEPFSTTNGSGRDQVIERLIDRTLVLQQSALQPDPGDTKEEVDRQLQSLRRDLPECKHYHCGTDAGWDKFIVAQGFSKPELEQRWTQRLRILRFIKIRFSAGVDITSEEIKAYYNVTMLPAYAKANAVPPKLDVLSARIQELLLEQRVSALLSDWLRSLKAEGTVRMMRTGEVEP